MTDVLVVITHISDLHYMLAPQDVLSHLQNCHGVDIESFSLSTASARLYLDQLGVDVTDYEDDEITYTALHEWLHELYYESGKNFARINDTDPWVI